jgi:hypothetical protein
LRALEDEWREHPPVHYLVATHLDYKPASPPEPDESESGDSSPAGGRPEWLSGMGKNLPAPEGLTHATTPEEALASLERMFFGEVNGF